MSLHRTIEFDGARLAALKNLSIGKFFKAAESDFAGIEQMDMLYRLQSIERTMTSESVKLSGRCACGDVVFSVLAPKSYGVCHCQMCRRWCGGLWMGVVCDEVHDLSGDINHWNSSKIASRGTCANCGSSIWYKLKAIEKYTFGQGLFDDQTGWSLSREIFCDGKPDHYSLAAVGQKAFTGWGTLWAALLGKLPK